MPKRQLSTGTDWKRVQREAAADTPIPHVASDGPYDPNDSAAVTAYWQQATMTRGRGRPRQTAQERKRIRPMAEPAMT